MNPTFSIRLDPEDRSELATLAESLGLLPADLIRMSVKALLKSARTDGVNLPVQIFSAAQKNAWTQLSAGLAKYLTLHGQHALDPRNKMPAYFYAEELQEIADLAAQADDVLHSTTATALPGAVAEFRQFIARLKAGDPAPSQTLVSSKAEKGGGSNQIKRTTRGETVHEVVWAARAKLD
jgi:hypothetical protein